jgi:hypothetical protein
MAQRDYIGLAKPVNPVDLTQEYVEQASFDYRYGPYATLAAACTALPVDGSVVDYDDGVRGRRTLGLTVGIIQDGKIFEYWWKEGLGDANLISKGDVPADTATQDDILNVRRFKGVGIQLDPNDSTAYFKINFEDRQVQYNGNIYVYTNHNDAAPEIIPIPGSAKNIAFIPSTPASDYNQVWGLFADRRSGSEQIVAIRKDYIAANTVSSTPFDNKINPQFINLGYFTNNELGTGLNTTINLPHTFTYIPKDQVDVVYHSLIDETNFTTKIYVNDEIAKLKLDLEQEIELVSLGMTWREPVATEDDLPELGNVKGDARLVLAVNIIFVWDGDEWDNTGLTSFPTNVVTKDYVDDLLLDKANIVPIDDPAHSWTGTMVVNNIVKFNVAAHPTFSGIASNNSRYFLRSRTTADGTGYLLFGYAAANAFGSNTNPVLEDGIWDVSVPTAPVQIYSVTRRTWYKSYITLQYAIATTASQITTVGNPSISGFSITDDTDITVLLSIKDLIDVYNSLESAKVDLKKKANLMNVALTWNPANFIYPAGTLLQFTTTTTPVLSGAGAIYAVVNNEEDLFFGFYRNDDNITRVGLFRYDGTTFNSVIEIYATGTGWKFGGRYLLQYDIHSELNNVIGGVNLDGFDIVNDISIPEVKDLIDTDRDLQEAKQFIVDKANLIKEPDFTFTEDTFNTIPAGRILKFDITKQPESNSSAGCYFSMLNDNPGQMFGWFSNGGPYLSLGLFHTNDAGEYVADILIYDKQQGSSGVWYNDGKYTLRSNNRSTWQQWIGTNPLGSGYNNNTDTKILNNNDLIDVNNELTYVRIDLNNRIATVDDKKVNKTANANQIYGTGPSGEQTTYPLSSAGGGGGSIDKANKITNSDGTLWNAASIDANHYIRFNTANIPILGGSVAIAYIKRTVGLTDTFTFGYDGTYANGIWFHQGTSHIQIFDVADAKWLVSDLFVNAIIGAWGAAVGGFTVSDYDITGNTDISVFSEIKDLVDVETELVERIEPIEDNVEYLIKGLTNLKTPTVANKADKGFEQSTRYLGDGSNVTLSEILNLKFNTNKTPDIHDTTGGSFVPANAYYYIVLSAAEADRLIIGCRTYSDANYNGYFQGICLEKNGEFVEAIYISEYDHVLGLPAKTWLRSELPANYIGDTITNIVESIYAGAVTLDGFSLASSLIADIKYGKVINLTETWNEAVSHDPIHKTVVLANTDAVWVTDGNYVKATINDTDIVDGCIIDAYPAFASQDVASAAEICADLTPVPNYFYLRAKTKPTDSITIYYTIQK